MKPEARKSYLDSIGVYKNAFESETGKLKENLVADTNRRAISSNLRTISGTLTHKPIKGTEKITQGAENAKKTVERIVGADATVVVTNELEADAKATFNPNDGVIYINNNADLTKKDVAQAVALHEVTHTTEGTKAYARLVEQIEAVVNDKNAPESVKKIVGDFTKRQMSASSAYESEMEPLNLTQTKYLVDTEVNADLIGDLLSDDYFVDKLAERDEGLLKKLYNSFKNRANAKKSELGPDGIKYLNKLASKFATAIDKRAGGVKLSQLGGDDSEDTQETVNVRYSKSNEQSSIRDQLRNNSAMLNEMEPVTEINSKLLSKKEMEGVALEEFKKIGYQVDRQNFGVIQIGKSEILGTFNYLNSPGEVLALLAVPKVLKRGMIIDGHNNHKNRNYETITIAAPVVINGTRGNVGVIVKQGGKNKYKTHRILMPDGSEFVFETKKDAEPTLAGVKGENHRQGPTISSPSNSIISETTEKINSSDERKSKNRSYDPKNGKDISNDPKVAERAIKENTSSLVDGKTTFVGLTDADLDEYLAIGKTLHTRNKKRRMLENGKKPILTTENEIVKFIKKAIQGEALGEVRAFGKVDERLAQAVSEVRSTLNLEGKYLEIQADAIREAYKVHSIPKEQGDIPLSKDDFTNLHRHIFDFDGVLSVNTHNGKTEIHLYKKSANGYYHILTVVSSERNALQITKLVGVSKGKFEAKYAKKIERSTGSLRMPKTSNPSTKAQHTAGVLSNNSIPKNGEKVNSSDERKSKNRSYDPKNGKDITFEEVQGGIKVNFNDFDTAKSNDKSNDFEVAERARKDSLDALIENTEPPKKEAVIIDNSLLRRITNNTKAKKFTRKDVKNIVDELLSQDGYFGDNFIHLKGKQRAEAERMLWQELNTKSEGELGSVALDIADYIIRNTIATEYLEVTEDVQLAVQFVDAIKPYLHNMNLEAIKGDIKAKFDDNNSPYLMWAVRKNSDFRGYTADEVKQELEALGLGFAFEKTSEADIFFEINDLYKLAKQTIIDATPSKQTLLTAIGTDEAKKLKQKLAKDIVDAQYTKGTETSFYKLQQKYIDKIAKLGNEVKAAHRRNTLENRILKKAKKISDSNKHTFANATEIQTNALKNIKSLLSRINSHEQVNRTSLREIMKELSLWYSQDNPVLGYTDEQHPGFFSKQIAEQLSYFAQSEGDSSENQFLSKFEKFTEQQIKNWSASDKIIVAENEAQVEDFVSSALKRKTVGKKMLIGMLPESVTKKIKKSTGVDLMGFNFELRADELLHIKKHHGNTQAEASRGQQKVDVQEIMNIIEVVTNFDSVEIGDKPNSLVFEKTIDGLYHAVTYYAYGNKSIYPQTLYITKKGGLAQTNNASGKIPHPARNAQDDLSTATDSIIPQNSQNVKREKPLSIDELEHVNVILHHMNHIFENYGKIWKGGKYVEAADVVKTHYEVLEDAEKNVPSFERMFLQNKYVRFFMDPMSVLATWDGHDPNGYFTTTYKDLVEGLINQRYDEMQALKELDEFRNDKKNKAYMKLQKQSYI